MHGWIVLDKPLGLGSTQAVSAVKRGLRACGIARPKVGHGGTLDPLATGVLPIAIGEATKLAGRMLDARKTYAFTISFGIETDTLDAEGRVVRRSEHRPSAGDVAAVLPRFTGEIEQLPPAYSALKVDGTRAYELARAGEAVVLAARRVTVFALALIPPAAGEDASALDSARLVAEVSKGTYIRSLARDIARALGTVGHVALLRRTRAGPFGLDEAISLDKLEAAATEQRLQGLCLPLETALDGIPALALLPVQATALRHGRPVEGSTADDGLYLASEGNVPVALVQAQAGILRVVRGFNL